MYREDLSIKELRLEAGYTQKMFADRTLCSIRNIQNWEQGRTLLPYTERWIRNEYETIINEKERS